MMSLSASVTVAGRRAKKETDRLCSDDETRVRDGKTER
jgi:hypothetical protein